MSIKKKQKGPTPRLRSDVVWEQLALDREDALARSALMRVNPKLTLAQAHRQIQTYQRERGIALT
jgi:hypothetical protein